MSAGRDEPRAHSQSTRRDLLDAARYVCASSGSGASVAEILELSGHGASALYHHYGSRAGLIRALMGEMGEFVESGIRSIDTVDSPDLALLEWMTIGIDVVRNYGLLGLEAASYSLPVDVACAAGSNTEHDVKVKLLCRLADSAACEPRISIAAGARLWVSLAHPRRVLRALDEGMTLREIEAETLDWFLAIFCPDYPTKSKT